jgi:acyl-CoA thioester hydrolase
VFQLAMAVRDYECDMQGVVNNAVYQNYLEHARHEFLKSKGLDFARLTEQGIIVVVVRADLQFKKSLRSGDQFVVTVVPVLQSPVRLVFEQTIIKTCTTAADDKQVMLSATITTTAVNSRGRPYFPAELAALLN